MNQRSNPPRRHDPAAVVLVLVLFLPVLALLLWGLRAELTRREAVKAQTEARPASRALSTDPVSPELVLVTPGLRDRLFAVDAD